MVEAGTVTRLRTYTCRFNGGPRDGLVQNGAYPPAEIRYPAARGNDGALYHVYRRGLAGALTVFYEYVGLRALPSVGPRPKRFSGQPD